MPMIKLVVSCTCAVLGLISKTKRKLCFLVVHCAWQEQEKIFCLFLGLVTDYFCCKSVVVHGLHA